MAQITSDQSGILENGDGSGMAVKGFEFTEQSIRKAFIKKVYSILMCQLLVTLAFIIPFAYSKGAKDFVRGPAALPLIITAIVGVFVCLIVMSCCSNVLRKTPGNFIFLGVFTVAESLLLGFVSTKYDSDIVMIAVGVTAVVCLALTLFAFQTKWDFTAMGGILLCALVVLIVFGIITIFIHNKTINLLYAALGVLLFSIYLVYDTQLMMGGGHKYSISPEDYIFAAISLYLDIINLFLYILREMAPTATFYRACAVARAAIDNVLAQKKIVTNPPWSGFVNRTVLYWNSSKNIKALVLYGKPVL